MVSYASTRFGDVLGEIGLAAAMLAIKKEVSLSPSNFLGVLELYDPDTCIFFTSVGEMEISLQEMHMVSWLLVGELPYEEHILTTLPLQSLNR